MPIPHGLCEELLDSATSNVQGPCAHTSAQCGAVWRGVRIAVWTARRHMSVKARLLGWSRWTCLRVDCATSLERLAEAEQCFGGWTLARPAVLLCAQRLAGPSRWKYMSAGQSWHRLQFPVAAGHSRLTRSRGVLGLCSLGAFAGR